LSVRLRTLAAATDEATVASSAAPERSLMVRGWNVLLDCCIAIFAMAAQAWRCVGIDYVRITSPYTCSVRYRYR